MFPLSKPDCHLTAASWADLSKKVKKENLGWRLQRRVATPAEKMFYKETRKGNVYFVDAVYNPTKRKREDSDAPAAAAAAAATPAATTAPIAAAASASSATASPVAAASQASAGCPNRSNIHHKCSPLCEKRWGAATTGPAANKSKESADAESRVPSSASATTKAAAADTAAVSQGGGVAEAAEAVAWPTVPPPPPPSQVGFRYY